MTFKLSSLKAFIKSSQTLLAGNRDRPQQKQLVSALGCLEDHQEGSESEDP